MKKKSKKLVSIILNCYNGSKYIKDAINSVKSQTYKNWELILVDNQSTDNTEKIVKEIKDKRIKYFKTKKHVQLYAARNYAVSKCKGQYVSFIDYDDWWLKNKIKKQIIFFNNNNADIVFSNLYIYNQKNKKKKIFIKNDSKEKITPQKLINNFQMPILTTMIKKKIFNNNKFNRNYSIIGDFDFFVRMSFSYNIMFLNECLACYRYHNNNLTNIKTALNIKELRHWYKNIKKRKFFNKFNYENVRNLIELLQIKNQISLKNKFKAIRMIFKSPIRLSKLKYLFFLLWK